MHLEQKKSVTMDFDRMGRRTFYKEMNGNTQVTFTRFVYKDYLCVRQVFSNSPYNTYKNFVWDPTETIATRPLKLQLPTMSLNLFYMHDGNKNVSDVVYRLTSNGVAAHYDYAPFGAVTRSVSNAVPTADITTLNLFRFSSEYHDDTLGLVYYNYRHYNPSDGRWTSRDPEFEKDSYLHSKNTPINLQDVRGLWVLSVGFNFSGSLLGGGTISFGIAISYDKNVGIEVATYASPGIGASAGIPAGSVGVQIQYSDDATTTDNLSGEACVMGGSAGAGLAIGIDESFPVEVESGYKFISVTLGLGTPKAEGHIFCTKTVVWKYKFTDCKIEEGEYNSYELINAPPGFYLGVM